MSKLDFDYDDKCPCCPGVLRYVEAPLEEWDDTIVIGAYCEACGFKVDY